jgi:predicted methyltransferase
MRSLIALGLVACGGAAASTPASMPMHHDFHDAARWAKVFDDPARDAWQKPAEVVAVMAIAPGMTVVDLGAGTGYFEPHLARAVGPAGRVLALDVEPDMVAHMTARARAEGLANVEARTVAPDDPGLGAGSVDRVLIVDTWHHLPARAAYARRLAAALAPGGAVVVVDFTLESAMGPPVHARVPAVEVVADLAAAGLDARIVEESLPEQYIVVGRRR